MTVREEDIPFIEDWARNNDVEVDLDTAQLTEENVDTVKGFDG